MHEEKITFFLLVLLWIKGDFQPVVGNVNPKHSLTRGSYLIQLNQNDFHFCHFFTLTRCRTRRSLCWIEWMLWSNRHSRGWWIPLLELLGFYSTNICNINYKNIKNKCKWDYLDDFTWFGSPQALIFSLITLVWRNLL